MAKQGFHPVQTDSRPEIEIIEPFTIDDIRTKAGEKFIIKFSLKHCPPCKYLQTWLESGDCKLDKSIVILTVQVDKDEQSEVVKYLREKFSFRTVPLCVFTNQKLENKIEMSGFNEDFKVKFYENVRNYF